MTVNNNKFQKNTNTSLIANLIRMNPNISRSVIAKELGLYKSTVTNIINNLLELNVVKQEKDNLTTSKTSGRKAIGLQVNSKFGCVVGFDLQPSHYRAVIVDFQGNLLWEDRGELITLSFEDLIDYVMIKVLAIVELIKLPLLGVCLGIPGIVDSSKGIIKHADAFNLFDYDLYSYGLNNYNVPFLVENDANCCAWFEIANNDRSKLGDFISIYSAFHFENAIYNDRDGIGIGLGLAINDKVYSGPNSYVGEFCSFSWNGDGQTGIEKNILFKAKNEENAFRTWFKDIAISLIPIVSVFNPLTLFLHGKPFSDEQKIRKYLKEDCQQFIELINQRKCKLSFDNSDDIIVAKGAAMMYLQKLFNLPTLEEVGHRPYINWDLAFEQASYKGNYLIKGDINVT